MTKKQIAAGKRSNPVPAGKDSHRLLLADVMSAVNNSLANKAEPDHAQAVARIHAIAENVRKGQARSSGQQVPSLAASRDRSRRRATRS